MDNNYTIKSGDTLWAITKQQLGQNASNKEIAEGYKKLAAANNIQDPNLIHAGAKLDTSIFNKNKEDDKENMYDRFESSSMKVSQDIAIKTAQDAGVEGSENFKLNNESAVFEFTPKEYANAKGDEKKGIYKEAILNMAQGELNKYDKADANGKKDNALDYKEFSAQQKEIYNKTYGEIGKLTGTEKAPGDDIFKGIFSNIDINQNGKLDKNELASTYAFQDIAYEYDENGEIKKDKNDAPITNIDGKIDGKNIFEMSDNTVLKKYHDSFFQEQ